MKIMKTKAADDRHGLLTIPVIPAGLTPGEQVEVVLASRGDEAAPLLLNHFSYLMQLPRGQFQDTVQLSVR